MYNNNQAVATDSQSELRIILEQFQSQLKRYDDLSTGIVSIGHRLRDTNLPTPDAIQKESKETSDGLLYELRKCNERLSMLNDRTEQSLSKLSGIV